MIADDSTLVQERLALLLSEVAGVEIVGQVLDAPEAEKSVRSLLPDVLILDIRMPTGTGIDVLRALRGLEPRPVIIVLTNYPYAQHEKACLALGADYFFDKSTEFEKVIEVIRTRAQEGGGLP
jgi:DNA-binding NarL/FixJ family response regulator